MRRSKVLNFKKINGVLNFVSKNRIIIFLCAVFVLGFVFGILSKQKSLQNYFKLYIQEFVTIRCSASFVKVALNSFFESLTFVFILYALGTSVFGMITSPIMIFLKGYFFGGLLSLLYSQFSLRGIAFNAVIILPSAIFLVLAILLSGENSIRFSCLLARLTIRENESQYVSATFKQYSLKYLYYLGFILVSALLDALISKNFLTKFEL